MTVNKSQGQTLKRVGLYLPQPAFGHGQLYVALSRVGHIDDVRVLLAEVKGHQGQTALPRNNKYITSNVVYTEVLHRQ